MELLRLGLHRLLDPLVMDELRHAFYSAVPIQHESSPRNDLLVFQASLKNPCHTMVVALVKTGLKCTHDSVNIKFWAFLKYLILRGHGCKSVDISDSRVSDPDGHARGFRMI